MDLTQGIQDVMEEYFSTDAELNIKFSLTFVNLHENKQLLCILNELDYFKKLFALSKSHKNLINQVLKSGEILKIIG